MAVSQRFEERLKEGDIVERELASLCSEYGWQCHKILGGFGSKIPHLVFNGETIKAPDIRIERQFHPSIAVECKSKGIYDTYKNGPVIYYDIHRFDYARNWQSATQVPLLVVCKTEKPYVAPNRDAFLVASINKLDGNHVLKDPGKQNQAPSYHFPAELFVPFEKSFLAGNFVTKQEIRFFDSEENLL